MKASRASSDLSDDNEAPRIGRVVIDRTLCIGAGNCCGMAPDLFSLDDEGKAVLASGDFSDIARIADAAWSCPTDAISIFGDDGERIYPPPERRSYLNL